MELIQRFFGVKTLSQSILIVIMIFSCCLGIFQSGRYALDLSRNEEDSGSYRLNKLYKILVPDRGKVMSIISRYPKMSFYTDAAMGLDRETVFYALRYLIAPNLLRWKSRQSDPTLMLCFNKGPFVNWASRQQEFEVLFKKEYYSFILAIVKRY
ncbi:hypothetical protein ACFL96_12425 [Thermoproteota archaeon]